MASKSGQAFIVCAPARQLLLGAARRKSGTIAISLRCCAARRLLPPPRRAAHRPMIPSRPPRRRQPVANVEFFIHHRSPRGAAARRRRHQGCTLELHRPAEHVVRIRAVGQPPAAFQGLQTHTLTFVNVATRAAPLLAACERHASAFADIQAGQRTAVKTYTGDAWVAHSAATGELLMQHQVGPADIRSCAQCDDVAWQPLVTCPPRQPGKHNSSKRPDYEPASFFNAADEPVDIYLQGSGCEHLMTPNGSVAPGGQAHFAAWAGQRFTARRAEGTDRRVLLALHLGEILIRLRVAQPRAPPAARRRDGGLRPGRRQRRRGGVPNAGDLAKWTKSNLETNRAALAGGAPTQRRASAAYRGATRRARGGSSPRWTRAGARTRARRGSATRATSLPGSASPSAPPAGW